MDTSSVFKGDPVDRYSDDKTNKAEAQFGSGNAVELETKLEKAAGTDGDIVNWLLSASSRIETAKAAFRTDPAVGASILRKLEDERTANFPAIQAYSQLPENGGSLTQGVREAAAYMGNASFLNEEMVMPSGKSVRVGQYLDSPESRSSLRNHVSSTLLKAGFDDDMSSALYGFLAPSSSALSKVTGGDQEVSNYTRNYNDQARKIAEFFTAPTMDVSHMRQNTALNGSDDVHKYVDMGNEIISNYDEYFQMFGTRTAEVMKEAFAGLKDIGGSRMLMSICRYASVYGMKNNLSGGALMRRVVSQLRDYHSSVSQTERPLSRGERRDPNDFSTYEHSAALITAMGEMADYDASFDIDNPGMRAEAKKLAEVLARMKSSGFDFTAACRDRGVDPIRDMASVLVRGQTGASAPGSMIDAAYEYFYSGNRATGGKDFADRVFSVSGRASDYFSSLDRRNGGSSSNRSADAMAAQVNKIRDAAIFGEMIEKGVTPAGAMASIQLDYGKSSKYYTQLADAIGRWFHGPGAKDATDLMIRYISERDDAGGPINIQSMIEDFASDRALRKDNQKATESFDDWLTENISDAEVFGPVTTVLFDRLRGDGMAPEDAQAVISDAVREAGIARRAGKDWRMVFRPYLDSYQVPQYIKDSEDPEAPDDVRFRYVDLQKTPVTFTRVTPDGKSVPTMLNAQRLADPNTRQEALQMLRDLNTEARRQKVIRDRYMTVKATTAARNADQ